MSNQGPESFEVQEYNDVREPYQTFQTIKQIVQDLRIKSNNPSVGLKADFLGDVMRVNITLFEMHVSRRMKEIQDAADQLHKSFLRDLKKEFKKRTKHDLKLKEDKAKADCSVQSVSMNERAYVTCWRFYEMDV